MHGYNVEKVSFRGLSEPEAQKLVGNVTTATSLAVVLTVCLRALDVLRQ